MFDIRSYVIDRALLTSNLNGNIILISIHVLVDFKKKMKNKTFIAFYITENICLRTNYNGFHFRYEILN